MKSRYTDTQKIMIGVLISVLCFSQLTLAATNDPPTVKFSISPATIPAGRNRMVKITTEPAMDLSGFSVEEPSSDTGVLFDSGNGQLSDNNRALLLRITVEDDAEEQTFPLIIKREKNSVTEKHTVELTVTAFKPRAIPSQATPPGVGKNDAVDSMIQPMTYEATKDVFGRRVAEDYYAVVIALGNNTGFDLQINKIAFNSTILIDVPDVNPDNPTQPVMDGDKVKTHKEFLQITAVDRTLVRPTVEKDQIFGRRAFALNLIGGLGTLTTGFLPFFHALGPRANFSSFSSIVNGQFKEGFNIAVPDLTIRQLSRLDNSIVMDEELLLPNNSERNTLVFVPRAALKLEKKDREDLQKVKASLGSLIIVGRPVSRYANRQIVIRTGTGGTSFTRNSDAGGSGTTPAGSGSKASPESPATTAPTVTTISPTAGIIAQPGEVKITGGNFAPNVEVKFGTQKADIKSFSPTEIVAQVPVNPAGTVQLVVVNPDGKQSAPKNYTYYSELTVGGTDRASGSTAGGDIVKIIGTGFIPGVKVSVGGTELPSGSVTLVNANTIRITMPAHAVGTVPIAIVNPSPYPNQTPKEVVGGFTYVAPVTNPEN